MKFFLAWLADWLISDRAGHFNRIELDAMRIVTLLPSATEIVCRLGLREQLVGVTHECDFPESVLGLPKVTRTLIPSGASSAQIDEMVRRRARERMALYELDEAMVSALRPDLIVTQALCDVCAVDETEVRRAAGAMEWGPRIVNLEPMSLGGMFDSLRDVGVAANVPDQAETAIAEMKQRVSAVVERGRGISKRPSVVFLEWLNPLFCGGHWNPELIDLAGGVELIGKSGERSRRIEWPALQAADPDVLFIACCGFSEARTRADLESLRDKAQWNGLKAVRIGRVYVADGSAYFSRPGPRLVESLEILANALHPQIHPEPGHAVADSLPAAKSNARADTAAL
jgi:iron complex transport system substrate-binding protein